MKKVLLYLNGLLLLLLVSTPALAGKISVEIINDQGYAFPTYPTDSRNGSYRSYLQAERNVRYGIRITNQTNRRVGLVVTVDGRNIISGKKSYLRNTEKMYVLDPHSTATYNGWRTGRNNVRRFYFTNESNSYADAWGDNSAMGVIAIAAYAEQRQQIRTQPTSRRYSSAPSPAAESRAGTGYGESEHSSSVRVEFTPEHRALEKHFYKYEWRETLCRKGIIPCARPLPPRRDNRFWPNDGYAPPPPPRRR